MGQAVAASRGRTSPLAGLDSALMFSRFRACIATLLVGTTATSACPGPRREVPSSALLPAGDTLVVPVQEVADAAWLGNARWAVLSPLDHAVLVVDFTRKSVSPFGGASTREIEQPFHLFRDGATVWVADWQRRRATQWSEDGRLLGEFPAADALRGALPRARTQGAWLYELRSAPGRDGSGNRDSAAIVRVAGASTDTIARLAPFDLAEVVSDGRPRLERRLLSGQDRWGVTPGGRLWVARVDKNRVDWVTPDGSVTRGEQLPDRVLPVTQNDRDLFLNRFEPGLRSTVEAIPFAAIKPPFDFAQAGPGESVWLTKSRAVGDSIRFYQVVDSAGSLVAELTHPGLGRVVAIGGAHALVAETIEKGVRLLLYRMPAP